MRKTICSKYCRPPPELENASSIQYLVIDDVDFEFIAVRHYFVGIFLVSLLIHVRASCHWPIKDSRL